MKMVRRFPGIGDLVEDIESQSLRKSRKGIEPGLITPPNGSMMQKIKKMNGKEKLVR
jgi:hypothetical protein